MPVDTNRGILVPRHVLRDLVALSAMQAVWARSEPAAVAAGLADVLIELLQLDFVFVRLCVPGAAGAVDVRRGTAWKTVPEWLDGRLATSGGPTGMEIIPDVSGSAGPCRGLVIPIGVNAEGGVIAVACDRIGFPTDTDQLLLSLAGNHAAAVFQAAHLREQQAQMWFLESMDGIDRAIQRASDLAQLMGDVLDVVLATFRCDRAWLVYLCDPEADWHQVRMERTRPDYAGAIGSGVDFLNEPGVASAFRRVLASRNPVRFDPASDCVLPSELATFLSIQSMIAMAVYPKVDKPYLFTLHQCSHPRVWTAQEERLFYEIGRRLTDALDSQLMFQNLRESERKLERSRGELAASRARIVAAADATRRRIERNLHDGAQQRLVSLGLQLRAAQAAAPPGTSELVGRLEGAVTEVTGILEELREIARGLHPAILTESGLRPALRALARRCTVPVYLDVQVAGRLPEPVEVAAYYAVCEALTNTTKYAHASAAEVEVAPGDGVLRVCVHDDGRGGADLTRGSGLVGLKDRVEALGGRIWLHSPPGAGTTLQVTVPFNDPSGPGLPADATGP